MKKRRRKKAMPFERKIERKGRKGINRERKERK